MGIEKIESVENNLEKPKAIDVNDKLNSLHDSFQSSFAPDTVIYASTEESDVLSKSIGGTTDLLAVGAETVKDSYEDLKDYKDGNIDSSDLAYQLGENAAGLAGAVIGEKIGIGADLGSEAAKTVYKETVELVSENHEVIQESATKITDAVSTAATDAATSVKEATENITENVSNTVDSLADKAAELKNTAFTNISGLFNH